MRAAHSSMPTIASNSRTRSSCGDGDRASGGAGRRAPSSSGDSRARSATQGRSSGGAPHAWTRSRSSSAQRPKGAPPPRSRPAHTAAAAPSALAVSISFAAIRVFPMPASPLTATTPPRPCLATRHASTSDSNSSIRPVNGSASASHGAPASPAPAGSAGAGLAPAEHARQRPRLLRGADPELREEAVAEPVVDGQGPGPVAGRREHPHEVPRDLLRERIEREPPAAPVDRLGPAAFGLGLARQSGEHGGELALVLLARLEHPVVVEVAEQPAAAEIDRAGGIAGRHQPPELAEVGPDLLVEADLLPRRPQVAGGGSERGAQGPQRAAKAGPRARVEHVGPEAARQLAPGMQARVDGQPAEEAPWPAGRQIDALAFELDLQRPEQPNDHGGPA